MRKPWVLIRQTTLAGLLCTVSLPGGCLSYTNILTRPLVIELLPHRLIPIKNTT